MWKAEKSSKDIPFEQLLPKWVTLKPSIPCDLIDTSDHVSRQASLHKPQSCITACFALMIAGKIAESVQLWIL